MTRHELLLIMEAMETYGGGFVKKLAQAMQVADNHNLERIVVAFPEIIERYKKFVKN